MLKMAMKLKARVAAESERKTAEAAAEVVAEAAAAAAALAQQQEPLAPRKSGKTPKKPLREVPPEKFPTDKERKKIEKKLLEQRRKEEKKREKERKKLEKMLKKKMKKVPEAQQKARGPEAGAAATAAATAAAEDEGAEEGAAWDDEEGAAAAAGGPSRAWARWETDSFDEDDAYYRAPRVGGVVWRPGPAKDGALSDHLPLVVFLVFSVRSPSWVLNFLLQRRTEQGRGCGFVFGATCCFRVFLGCAFFSYLSGRAKRRSRARSGAGGAFGSGHGGRRRGREERLI